MTSPMFACAEVTGIFVDNAKALKWLGLQIVRASWATGNEERLGTKDMPNTLHCFCHFLSLSFGLSQSAFGLIGPRQEFHARTEACVWCPIVSFASNMHCQTISRLWRLQKLLSWFQGHVPKIGIGIINWLSRRRANRVYSVPDV